MCLRHYDIKAIVQKATRTQEVIYQTREIQTPRSGLKKRGAAEFFFSDFEEFGYLMKHSFEVLIWLLKPFIILGEIQPKACKILC